MGLPNVCMAMTVPEIEGVFGNRLFPEIPKHIG